MSAEQGDVETVRTALSTAHPISADDHDAVEGADVALDRLAAALERAERELFVDVERVPMCRVTVSSSWHAPVRCAYAEEHPGDHSWATLPQFDPVARAKKAERALAENEQAWEDMRAYNIRLEERAREAECALAEIIAEADELLLWQPGKKGYAVAHKRFYAAICPYRSSEDTSDES